MNLWPERITMNGIEYEHRCHPTRSARDFPRMRRYVCPCGRMWTRLKRGTWMHQSEDEERTA